MRKKNGFINGIIPVILMSFATGSVYSFTILSDRIESHSPLFTPTVLAWCFSLALFCLGISAAFVGKLVEKNVKLSALLTFIFFTLGWLLFAIGIHIESPALLILGFGPIQGFGLGIGYLTPVKTLMMWFSQRKGLAAGVAIAAFGLSGIFGNPMFEIIMQSGLTVYNAIYLMTAIFGLATFISYLLIDRPAPDASMLKAPTIPIKQIVFNPKFMLLWIVLFINITAGLAIISNERQIYLTHGIENDTLIVVFTSLGALGNLVGRVICAGAQDKTDKKYLPYYAMTGLSLLVCLIGGLLLTFGGGTNTVTGMILLIIFAVQFFFGCGFACLPYILEQEYGMKQLATVQGLMLTAWAMAGLVGNQISTFIIDRQSPESLNMLFVLLGGFYFAQFVILVVWVKVRNKQRTASLELATH